MGINEKKINIDLTPEAREWLADAGYDPVYGARPLKRTIQRSVQDVLAEQILAGDVKSGDSVVFDAGADGLEVSQAAIQ